MGSLPGVVKTLRILRPFPCFLIAEDTSEEVDLPPVASEAEGRIEPEEASGVINGGRN
jgi:hypothetical protein